MKNRDRIHFVVNTESPLEDMTERRLEVTYLVAPLAIAHELDGRFVVIGRKNHDASPVLRQWEQRNVGHRIWWGRYVAEQNGELVNVYLPGNLYPHINHRIRDLLRKDGRTREPEGYTALVCHWHGAQLIHNSRNTTECPECGLMSKMSHPLFCKPDMNFERSTSRNVGEKAAWISMTNPTEAGRQLMEQLGLTILESDGTPKTWEEIVTSLEKKLFQCLPTPSSRGKALTEIASYRGSLWLIDKAGGNIGGVTR